MNINTRGVLGIACSCGCGGAAAWLSATGADGLCCFPQAWLRAAFTDLVAPERCGVCVEGGGELALQLGLGNEAFP